MGQRLLELQAALSTVRWRAAGLQDSKAGDQWVRSDSLAPTLCVLFVAVCCWAGETVGSNCGQRLASCCCAEHRLCEGFV